MDIERLARTFHEAYERLAPSFGYATRKDTRDFDAASPNGRLMMAVCGEVASIVRSEALEEAARALDPWNPASDWTEHAKHLAECAAAIRALKEK